jgi:ABC-type multidrug transport system ATPase subunit
MSELAIDLRGVVKRYGPITAVGGLDVQVPAGTCVGLLGPNGAGKSTTMRMLTGQTIADEAELDVLGTTDGFDGDRRPANLEDVFVLLTGEEIG